MLQGDLLHQLQKLEKWIYGADKRTSFLPKHKLLKTKFLSHPRQTVNKVFELGGEAYYWKEVIEIISGAYGKNKWIIPAPVFAVKSLAAVFGRFARFLITSDQLIMLVEGNICSSKDIFEVFDINPIPFNSDSLAYLKN